MGDDVYKELSRAFPPSPSGVDRRAGDFFAKSVQIYVEMIKPNASRGQAGVALLYLAGHLQAVAKTMMKNDPTSFSSGHTIHEETESGAGSS